MEFGFEDGGETLRDEEEALAVDDAEIARRGERVEAARVGMLIFGAESVGSDLADEFFGVFGGSELSDAVDVEAAAVGDVAILRGAIENAAVDERSAAGASAGDVGLHGI